MCPSNSAGPGQGQLGESASLGLAPSDTWALAGGQLLHMGSVGPLSSAPRLCHPSPGGTGPSPPMLLLAVTETQEHKPNLTNNFQASTCVVTDDLLSTKASHVTIHSSSCRGDLHRSMAGRLLGKVNYWCH